LLAPYYIRFVSDLFTEDEEKKGLPNWAKTTAKVAGGVAGLGLVGGLGVLAYQHFKGPIPTGDGGGAETVVKALKRLF
jgi:hypothetical protein